MERMARLNFMIVVFYFGCIECRLSILYYSPIATGPSINDVW